MRKSVSERYLEESISYLNCFPIGSRFFCPLFTFFFSSFSNLSVCCSCSQYSFGSSSTYYFLFVNNLLSSGIPNFNLFSSIILFVILFSSFSSGYYYFFNYFLSIYGGFEVYFARYLVSPLLYSRLLFVYLEDYQPFSPDLLRLKMSTCTHIYKGFQCERGIYTY